MERDLVQNMTVDRTLIMRDSKSMKLLLAILLFFPSLAFSNQDSIDKTTVVGKSTVNVGNISLHVLSQDSTRDWLYVQNLGTATAYLYFDVSQVGNSGIAIGPATSGASSIFAPVKAPTNDIYMVSPITPVNVILLTGYRL